MVKPNKSMAVVDEGIDHGIRWMTCRAPLYGAVNGYVRLPGDGWTPEKVEALDLDAPGGLTYQGRDEEGFWWIGFDTLHAGDFWQGMPEFLEENRTTFWCESMVASEAATLARAVAEAVR